jgi:hypothetical protein
MTSAQIRRFSTIASESRNSSYGVTATFGASTITIVCQPLTDLELAAGGFEQNGIMRALVSGITIPDIHDRLVIGAKTWVVRKKVTSLASVETGLTLEAIPA